MMDEYKNYVKIEGPEEDIKQFLLQAQGGNWAYKEHTKPFSLSNFIPMPKEFALLKHSELEYSKKVRAKLFLKYGIENAIDWCMVNWGTVYDLKEVTYDEKTHVYSFTNSTLPIVGFIKISLLYPTLRFIYRYGAFENDKISECGKLIFKNGKVEHEEYWNPINKLEVFGRRQSY